MLAGRRRRIVGFMPTVLVVHHSPTPAVRALADFVLDASRSAAAEANEVLGAASGSGHAGASAGSAGRDRSTGAGSGLIDVVEVNALEPHVEQLREADAVIFGTTANFGYISGALKHYFDSTFMEIGEELRGIPMSWWIRGGFDTTGASKAMQAITTGYGWSPVAPPVEFTGEVEPHHDELRDMAQAVVGALLT